VRLGKHQHLKYCANLSSANQHGCRSGPFQFAMLGSITPESVLWRSNYALDLDRSPGRRDSMRLRHEKNLRRQKRSHPQPRSRVDARYTRECTVVFSPASPGVNVHPHLLSVGLCLTQNYSSMAHYVGGWINGGVHSFRRELCQAPTVVES
jgi:hypothetical protein